MLSDIYDTSENPGKIIIFVETKRRVDHLVRFIRSFGVRCGAIHGDKSQSERDFVLREFRSGKSNILVATDVAARGLGKCYKTRNGIVPFVLYFAVLFHAPIKKKGF